MTEEVSIPVINTHVGKAFNISLESMEGSTGYGWHLAGMPDCLVFLGEKKTPLYPDRMIGPILQTFTFAAVKICSASLQFSLLAPWKPLEPADEITYHVNVTEAAKAEKKLGAAIGPDKFISRAAHMDHMTPVPPYGVTFNPEDGGFGDTVHPLYGYPIPDGAAVGIVESREKCVVKYGTPWGVAASPEQCTLKYGFPVGMGDCVKDGVVALYGTPPCALYGFPPVTDYGFPDCREKRLKAMPNKVVEDKDRCVLMYGVATGIALNPDDCTLKYGFPVRE